MVLDFIQFTGKRESRWGIVICLSLNHEERLYTIGDPSSWVMFVHNQKGYGRTPGVDPSLYNQTSVACKWKKFHQLFPVVGKGLQRQRSHARAIAGFFKV